VSALRVAIAVDNPLRDLPSCVLLASALASRGATCYLLPLHAQARELPVLAPDAAVLNYLRPNNEALAARIVAQGTALFVHDTEGGVIPDFETYDQTLGKDSAVRAAVTAYCSWGARLAEHLVTGGWYRDDQVVVTGSPRFDFYADPWRAAALAASSPLDAHRPPFVLVNGNFPLANPRFQDPAGEVRMLVERFGFERALVERRQRDQRDAMLGLAEVANELAAARPETVVYRPHPFEDVRAYGALIDDAPNLRVVQAGTVDGWILRSVAVIQRSCTTAIEAALAGVPALDASWLPAAARMPAAEAVSRPCGSLAELGEVVAAAAAGTLPADDRVEAALEGVVAAWFCAVDGRAHERLADVVMERTPAGRAGPGTFGAADVVRMATPPELLRAVRTRRLGGLTDKRFDAAQAASIASAVHAAAGGRMPAFDVAPVSRDDLTGWLPFTRAIRVRAA
jgi:surface carbohydrate biosynthesis protein